MLLAYCFLLSAFPFEVTCVPVRDCALHDTIGVNGDRACLLPAAFHLPRVVHSLVSFVLVPRFGCVTEWRRRDGRIEPRFLFLFGISFVSLFITSAIYNYSSSVDLLS